MTGTTYDVAIARTNAGLGRVKSLVMRLHATFVDARTRALQRRTECQRRFNEQLRHTHRLMY